MWVLLLLWPLALGFSLGDTLTPIGFEDTGSAAEGDDITQRPHPRSFPGQPCANDSNTLELPPNSRALLLGWVPTRLVPALYGLALAVGLPANSLALWVLATQVPRLPSTMLLMNLAAADLLLALALPPRIAYHLRGQRWQQTFRLSHSDHVLCHDVLPTGAQASYWRPAFICLAGFGCFLPLLAMVLSYGATLRTLAAGGRRYGHALRLTALVLVSAVALFAPSNVLLLLHFSNPGPDAWGDLYAAYVPSLALSTLNSCVDPFIYYFVSAEFRSKVQEGLLRRGPGTATASREGGSRATGTRSSSLM
nr:PREDICTED: proteinase-activated receptor 4 [Bos mutus]